MERVYEIVAYIVPMLLSLTVHEYAHARVAYWLGDDTASSQGRLTLNPFVHADPIGTYMMPIIAQLAGGLPLIGWAKPVPVSPHRFTRRVTMHTGMALTAIAGPLSNLVLMLLAVVGLRLLAGPSELDFYSLLGRRDGEPLQGTQMAAHLLLILGFMNAGLAVFNLLPIPPLDGSRLMPRALQPYLAPLQTVSYFLLMAIVFFAGGIIRVPIAYLLLGAFWVAGLPNDWLWAMVHGG